MKKIPLQSWSPLRKAGIAAAVGLSLATGALLLHHGVSAAPPAQAGPVAIPVSVAQVAAEPVAVWEEFSGRLEAVEHVELRPRVAGLVQAVHFREGALVKQGELLLTLDPAPYAAEAERAQAQVTAAQARLQLAQTEQARAQRLLADRAIAQREFDERTNALHEAQANLQAAQAALQSARLNLGYTQVRAPISGRVGKLEITVGNQVAAGPAAPVLTTIVSISPIYASFDGDEAVVGKLLGARGQLHKVPVQLGTATQSGTPLQGHLQLVDNHVDARSGTVRLRAVFDNPEGQLVPGQFARLRLGDVQKIAAVRVAERALGTDQGKRFVMVVGADNKAEYRQVELGPMADGLRIVKSGLKPGERIVVNGLQRVIPGALLAPSVVGMQAAAPGAARS
ncbi:efflux RND transporter periplasmic adaptor subunit [Massilia sp. TS11]|uniref:efflux RND transporter periplasmic adaptor subunit n=1 Tax=Massilia sp. TS11 TaxID=2908003 RepID=UPI001EDB58EC|nr:efflux RND transporter periplasmic adaptor subunit [Massilia sp. TS11]MCG2585025.1 efflux RND transporter periplasmic adaptor subunit [Massilia sp. TS11]